MSHPHHSISRRTALGAATATAAMLTTTPSLAAPRGQEDRMTTDKPLSPVPGKGVARQRAVAAHDAMQKHFGTQDGSDLLREFHPHREDDNPYSYEWPFSQARIATDQLSRTVGGASLRLDDLIASRDRGQERYWHLAGGTTGLPGYASATDLEQGAHGTYFYDDNSWVALAELERHRASGGCEGDLDRVEEILALLRSARSSDESLPAPGGLFWSQGDDGDRNTVATMPAAKVALLLHQITGDASLLEDAREWVEWTREHLLSPEGLFWDHVKLDGTVEKMFWTYNQGVPIGVEVLLHQITGEDEHRQRALDLVDAVIDHYQVFTRGGRLDDDQPVFFNAILCANLLYAQSVLGDVVPGERITQEAAHRAWTDQRDPATDLSTRRNDKGELELLMQAGLTRLQALAAMAPPAWRHLA